MPNQRAEETRDSITDVWGERIPHTGNQWSERVDERVLEEPEKWVQSACVLCSNGCALDIGVAGGKIVGVRGRAIDRVNHGRLGPKGLHGWEANNSPDRLTKPLIRRVNGKFEEAGWDEAMNLIVERSKETIEKYTSGAIGIYNTGQLFHEEYYTLSIISHAGIGTNNVDGNTRLCTATAAQALKESFGSDGQPGSYADIDETDCLLLAGHNVSNTQTVLWARMLDRRRGENPPRLIVIDPRETETAKEADVHLAPRVGTNVAVMNGLINLVIENRDIDSEFIEKHVVGFEKLKQTVSRYPPERVREISGILPSQLVRAAKLIGNAEKLFSTVLQGFYQSHQATAASVQVNNLNLIRGMIGKPGCGVLQMNGQPTAENARETGCNGEFPAFRNWHNPEHLYDLARRWNVDPLKIPSWHLPAHAMEIFRHAETGSIKFLWIICTNPAVSLPELHRIRKILAQEKLFVVVQDAFFTETAELADVVLPAAIWGEKTGTFTNADRTVHISHKAVEPPGEAKSDFDIFLDYARRMDFRDKDGAPLVKWTNADGAFEHWKECSKGWVCDYSGMSYAKLSEGSGIQYPCNEENPNGTERLYSNFVFRTAADICETFGHDIETGAARSPEEYKANDPAGKAILKAADYHPPFEQPDEDYPFWLTTGRVVYHFHTRTKTGRSKQLEDAAPDAFVELSREDAERLDIKEGDMLEVASRRGTIQAPARIGEIIAGHVFVPFHYGYWDETENRSRAANELTLSVWDPVSKQPNYKCAAVQVSKAGSKPLTKRLADIAGKAAHKAVEITDKVMGAAHVERSRVADYLGILSAAEQEFAKACASVAEHHPEETEIQTGMKQLASFSLAADAELQQFIEKYGKVDSEEAEKLNSALFPIVRAGAFGLLRDLHNLFIMAFEIHVSLAIVMQASKELRDEEMLAFCIVADETNKRQLAWINTQIEHRASHTIVVPQ